MKLSKRIQQAVIARDTPGLRDMLAEERSPSILTEALLLASRNVYVDCMCALLSAGADPNCVDDSKSTPLHLCATERERQIGDILVMLYGKMFLPHDGDIHRDAVEALLKYGADLATTDRDGNTPLHAHVNTNSRSGMLLMACGASGCETNVQGITPLDDVETNMGREEREWVVGFARWPLHVACAAGSSGYVVRRLLAEGHDVNGIDPDGYAPAHWAISGDYLYALMALTEGRADLALTDKDGDTPAHLAAEVGSPEILQYLIDQRAPMNRTNHAGKTPLDVAIASTPPEALRKGVDPGDIEDRATARRVHCIGILKRHHA